MVDNVRDIRVLLGLESIEHALSIVKYLTDYHFRVEYLRVDNLQALKLALNDDWDIFICDVHLSVTGGTNFFKTINQLSINVPLILLCESHVKNDVVIDALAVGAIGVISMIELDHLTTIIEDILTSTQQSSQGQHDVSVDMLNDLPAPVILLDSFWCFLDLNKPAKKLIDPSFSKGNFLDVWTESSKVSLQQQLKNFSLASQAETTIGSIDDPLVMRIRRGAFYSIKIHRNPATHSHAYTLILNDITHDVGIYNRRLEEQKSLKDNYSNTLSRVTENQKRDTDTLLAKSQFLSQVSHEIRTPMNAIAGFADALNRRPLDPEAKMLANRISRASGMLLSVVNDLLDFSKIEANKLHIQSEPFFLNDVLDDLAFLMSGSAKAKQLELSIVSPPQQFTYLEGDDLRLKQILINLAANALKFTEQGSVSVNVSETHRGQGHIRYRFVVKDTGIGMNAEQISKIMQPFVQANVGISRRYGGTGLGLSICRSLVEKMGGELKVKSKPGEGSSFYFELNFPLLPYPDNKLQKIAAVKVLIADDNPIALKGLEATVAAMNWQPTTFSSGAELLQALADHPEWHGPHCLILLDWKMPHIDGFATAEKIHQLLPCEKRPITFMVTSRESDQLINSEEARYLDKILDKPLSPGVLYEAMLQFMNERSNNVEVVFTKRLANFHIFVVEDSDLNVELIKTILIDEGATLEVATNGYDAIENISSSTQKIDLVLMDLQLPDIQGFEVAAKLRTMFSSHDLPILAMTARDSEEDRQHAKQVGMNDWVAKPINRERLVLLIQQYGQAIVDNNEANAESKASSVNRFVRLRWERLPVVNSKSENIVTHERAVYQSLLQKFLNAYTIPMAKLESGELTEGEVFKLAHKLRGGSLSLGLERLSEICLVFEEYAAKNGKYCPAQQELASVLKQSLETVRPMLNQPVSGVIALVNNPQVVKEDLERCLNTGFELLESHDFEQINPFLSQLSELGMGQLLNDINHQLDDFDFRGAQRVIRSEAKLRGLSIHADHE
jgi:signal transduction histidine kinase/DNA-binding response OmpR family regulator